MYADIFIYSSLNVNRDFKVHTLEVPHELRTLLTQKSQSNVGARK